jgi:hypothetical protein
MVLEILAIERTIPTTDKCLTDLARQVKRLTGTVPAFNSQLFKPLETPARHLHRVIDSSTLRQVSPSVPAQTGIRTSLCYANTIRDWMPLSCVKTMRQLVPVASRLGLRAGNSVGLPMKTLRNTRESSPDPVIWVSLIRRTPVLIQTVMW